MSGRTQNWFCILAAISAITVWAAGLSTSHIGIGARAAETQYLNNEVKRVTQDRVTEKRFAAAYWRENPDVGNSTYFGPKGPFGVFGAREHYTRHGKQEGRRWPDPKSGR
jgi:hypothetical protein